MGLVVLWTTRPVGLSCRAVFDGPHFMAYGCRSATFPACAAAALTRSVGATPMTSAPSASVAFSDRRDYSNPSVPPAFERRQFTNSHTELSPKRRNSRRPLTSTSLSIAAGSSISKRCSACSNPWAITRISAGAAATRLLRPASVPWRNRSWRWRAPSWPQWRSRTSPP